MVTFNFIQLFCNCSLYIHSVGGYRYVRIRIMTKAKQDIVKKMMKIVYFDEDAARDYIDITNDGHLDWSEEENKEKLAKIAAEIDAEVGGGFKFISFLKASLQGTVNNEYSRETKKVVARQLSSTLLTEYIKMATDDKKVSKFSGVVYPSDNSMSKYKMYSPYSIIVPKDQVPIDLERLNEALDHARGYYEMLHIDRETSITSILRFNDTAFRNNYNLSDLTKMKLKFFAIRVGSCRIENLDMAKEFDLNNSSVTPTAENVLGISEEVASKELPVFDVIIAGVENE